MKRAALFLCLCATGAFITGPAGRAETTTTASDEQVAARSEVLDLAGAFQNDGFKIRDGDLFGKVVRDHSAIVSVNLYSGNAYWFSAASTKKEDKLSVAIFDDHGKPVSFQPYAAGNRAAAGFSPEASGLFYVKISNEDPEPATFCLIYCYK
ncbi:MAG: hypothetical protein JO069_05990 [Verrucomicrobia bacterium]|nr:hypothetical protein [Verrucomicrobiota bacterium]